MNAVDGSDRREAGYVLRNPARVRLIVFWAFFVALGLFGAIAKSGWGPATLMSAGLACFAVFAAVQGARSAIRCDGNGVTGTEVLTRHYAWSEIAQFEQCGLRGIGVRLTTGRWMRLMGFATFGDKSPEAATRDLERERISFQTGTR